jgi:hypothetical protein
MAWCAYFKCPRRKIPALLLRTKGSSNTCDNSLIAKNIYVFAIDRKRISRSITRNTKLLI